MSKTTFIDPIELPTCALTVSRERLTHEEALARLRDFCAQGGRGWALWASEVRRVRAAADLEESSARGRLMNAELARGIHHRGDAESLHVTYELDPLTGEGGWVAQLIKHSAGDSHFYVPQTMIAIEPGARPSTQTETRARYLVYWERRPAALEGDALRQGLYSAAPCCARFVDF